MSAGWWPAAVALASAIAALVGMGTAELWARRRAPLAARALAGIAARTAHGELRRRPPQRPVAGSRAAPRAASRAVGGRGVVRGGPGGGGGGGLLNASTPSAEVVALLKAGAGPYTWVDMQATPRRGRRAAGRAVCPHITAK
ncbi:hypothetical protein AB0G06_02300 [Nonomuraea dietziae]|uniref:hypothetical protein n=1 Tax=Nonomuraea dietziae TaxID=65515 RepID=UPI0033EAE992